MKNGMKIGLGLMLAFVLIFVVVPTSAADYIVIGPFVDENGDGVPGINVSFTYNGNKYWELTGADGNAVFEDFPSDALPVGTEISFTRGEVEGASIHPLTEKDLSTFAIEGPSGDDDTTGDDDILGSDILGGDNETSNASPGFELFGVVLVIAICGIALRKGGAGNRNKKLR